jgi:hypothetical protein
MVVNDPEMEKEGKQIIADLAKLKYELQHDRQIMLVPV